MLPLSFKEDMSIFEDKIDISKKARNYLEFSSFPRSVELYKANPNNIDLYLDGMNRLVTKIIVRK